MPDTRTPSPKERVPVIGIDAALCVSVGRGWGRFAEEYLRAIATRSDVETRVFLSARGRAADLASDLRKLGIAVVQSMDPRYPERRLGSIDLLHSLTHFLPLTAAPCVVAHVHDISPLSDPPFRENQREATLKALARIIEMRCQVVAVSSFTRDELIDKGGIDPSLIQVVHEGVAARLETVTPRSGPAASTSYGLYVGGGGPNKNLATLFSAWPAVWERCRAPLVLVGSPQWGYESLSIPVGTDWLSIRGYVSDDELSTLYRDAALVIAPSVHEGFGLPVLEAMAQGTPVVCSDIPPFEEIAGPCALYFSRNSAQDLADKVCRLLADSKLSRELSESGFERSRTFRWSRTVEETIGVYQRALELSAAKAT